MLHLLQLRLLFRLTGLYNVPLAKGTNGWLAFTPEAICAAAESRCTFATSDDRIHLRELISDSNASH